MKLLIFLALFSLNTFANELIIYDAGETLHRDDSVYETKDRKQIDLLKANDFVFCDFYNSRGFSVGLACLGGSLASKAHVQDTCTVLGELYSKTSDIKINKDDYKYSDYISVVAKSLGCPLSK